MSQLLESLILYALEWDTSDIHFVLKDGHLAIHFKTQLGMEPIDQDIWDTRLFEYLKYIAGFDLTNPFKPQSGQFSFQVQDSSLYCRFSYLKNKNMETGVLRLLRTNVSLKIQELTSNAGHIQFLNSLTKKRQGLIITSGPTNSGKTTTLHALLHAIAQEGIYNVMTLEDPIEIEDDLYIQLQINEASGFTYERGIEELLRHDPDVILIGETRNEYTARMLIRAALTGHLVFTTLHAKNALESILRLKDLGVSDMDLKDTLSAILSQRLYMAKDRKECAYEILKQEELDYAIEHKAYPKGHRTLEKEIMDALESGSIDDSQALFDLEDYQR